MQKTGVEHRSIQLPAHVGIGDVGAAGELPDDARQRIQPLHDIGIEPFQFLVRFEIARFRGVKPEELMPRLSVVRDQAE